MSVLIRFVLCFAAALLALFSTAQAGNPRYQMTQLRAVSTAAGIYASVYDINDAGVAVGSETANLNGMLGVPDPAKLRPLMWNANGSTTVLPNVSGGGGEAKAINNSSLVVGQSTTTGAPAAPRAAIFRTSGSILVPGHTGSGSFAVGVNDSGILAGSTGSRPFAYNVATSSEVPLNFTDFNWYTKAIAPNGDIYANGGTANGVNARPAKIKSSAAPQYLYTSGDWGDAYDVNASGVAVGGLFPGGQTTTPGAAIFANGNKTILHLNAGDLGYATGINDRGDIVGMIGPSVGPYQSFLRRDGQMIALSTLVNGSLPSNFIVIDVNNRGQIIGNAVVDHDNNPSTQKIGVAYRLDPIRSPGDTNDDNAVNFADLVTLAQNYGKSGNGTVFWETGDFDFNWNVDFNDLVTLAQNYNHAASFEADWALAQSLVPEPGVMAMTVAGAAVLARRRRGE